MNRKDALIFEIAKLFIDIFLIPLSFIKIFHYVAVLPGENANGEPITGRFDYFYSIYDKLFLENLLIILWVAFALIIISAVLAILNIAIKDNKKLLTASHITFGIAAGFFLITLIFAATIVYTY